MGVHVEYVQALFVEVGAPRPIATSPGHAQLYAVNLVSDDVVRLEGSREELRRLVVALGVQVEGLPESTLPEAVPYRGTPAPTDEGTSDG